MTGFLGTFAFSTGDSNDNSRGTNWRRASATIQRIAAAVAISVTAVGLQAVSNGNASAQAPNIEAESCEFFVDVDGDLKGDNKIPTGDDQMVIQDSLIVGSCKFKL